MFLSRLVHYFALYRWRYLAGFACLMAASIIVMLPPLVIREAVDAMDIGVG